MNKFKKGDLVTFSPKCAAYVRKAFKNGPRKITGIVSWHSYFPYEIGQFSFAARELKLVKK